MARRKNSGLAEALFDLTAALPWWVGVVLAVIAYAVLHRYAVMEVPTTLSAGQKGGDMLSAVVIKGLASGGQYLVPFILLAAAAASALGRRKRQGLIAKAGNDATGAALRTMSWRDFELLVGEAFRLRGYAVTELGGNGADGGVDLKLTRGGETFLVQCKRWKAYQVSVEVVRELYGVMAAQGAAGGFVVTSGTFTEPARNFAQGRNIELIDGPALKKMIDAVRPAVANKEKTASAPAVAMAVAAAPAAAAAPVCPLCGSPMVRRLAQRGANAGKPFWGCSRYAQTKCGGARAIEE